MSNKTCSYILFASLILGPSFGSIANAEDQRLVTSEQNPIQKSLEKVIGQTVTLKLGSGQEVSGVVAKVGTEAVQLTQLQGKEFFDALIPLQRVEALIVRAKS
jgi:hypothetical protein